MRRFRNNKPYYVIFTLSRDISEILLKCPKCYITILTNLTTVKKNDASLNSLVATIIYNIVLAVPAHSFDSSLQKNDMRYCGKYNDMVSFHLPGYVIPFYCLPKAIF